MQIVTEAPNAKTEPNATKQQLAAEIKAGKVPEMMLKSVPEQTAAQLKQRAETPVKLTKKSSKPTGKKK